MKEIWKKKKIFVITIALMVGIIGTAATFAIITATAGTVTNTFQAAKVATEIEEEFEGKIKAGSTVKKNPDGDGTGWYQGTDGWFYYNSPVAPGQNTDNLFDAVKIGNVTKNFDITVYQEAVFAGSYEAGDKVGLPVLKGFFAEVTK